MLFAETLKKLRTEKGLSQRELARELYVTQSTITRWENGSRLPDAEMIFQLAHHLGVDAGMLLSTAAEGGEPPIVIMVEDRELILAGGLSVLKEVMPNATIRGFEWPADAIKYAKKNWVSLAFVDIELGGESGLDLCRALLDINQSTNVVFLTAYADYALEAWDTGASGFMIKPITPEGVRAQLANLRHPFSPGGPTA
ncbi:MAG: helix-turn-helix domain-containing protein [Atopobiaceae bacterium]|nr:helix-turn-helix domain-containing protein [Atopobiaceae bacterium]